MREKRVALLALNGAVDNAAHVAALSHFRSRYMNLQDVAFGVLNCGAIDNAVQLCPESTAHTHGARLAGGIQRIAGERKRFEAACGQTDGTDLSVERGVELAMRVIQNAQQEFSGARIHNGCAERSWRGCFERSCSEGDQRDHTLGIERYLPAVAGSGCHTRTLHCNCMRKQLRSAGRTGMIAFNHSDCFPIEG